MRPHQRNSGCGWDVAGPSLLSVFHVCPPGLENCDRCLERGNEELGELAVLCCSCRRTDGQRTRCPKSSGVSLASQVLGFILQSLGTVAMGSNQNYISVAFWCSTKLPSARIGRGKSGGEMEELPSPPSSPAGSGTGSVLPGAGAAASDGPWGNWLQNHCWQGDVTMKYPCQSVLAEDSLCEMKGG